MTQFAYAQKIDANNNPIKAPVGITTYPKATSYNPNGFTGGYAVFVANPYNMGSPISLPSSYAYGLTPPDAAMSFSLRVVSLAGGGSVVQVGTGVKDADYIGSGSFEDIPSGGTIAIPCLDGRVIFVKTDAGTGVVSFHFETLA